MSNTVIRVELVASKPSPGSWRRYRWTVRRNGRILASGEEPSKLRAEFRAGAVVVAAAVRNVT